MQGKRKDHTGPPRFHMESKSVGALGDSPDDLSPRLIRSTLREIGRVNWGPASFDAQSLARKAASPNAHLRTAAPYVRRRSFSNPDLKITKKNVDKELSAFIELVGHLQISLQAKQQHAKPEESNAKQEQSSDILHELKTIAESFLHATPDCLGARTTILQIQNLYRTSATGTALEKELMIKLLFIISTCSRLEEYKVTSRYF